MPVRPIRTFTVLPHLPERLQPLQKIAYNMWWCWNHDAVSLFRRIDDDAFERFENSPVKLLGGIDQSRLEPLLRDEGFLAHMDRVDEALNNYMASSTWFQETYGETTPCRIAYFSAEFGIHESIPIYSGGLGVLAGDHLKAASDLGVPLAGGGLCYDQGYFTQWLDDAGWQQERYLELDTTAVPLALATTPGGTPVVVSIETRTSTINARV